MAEITKEQVLEIICKAIQFDTLGLFIGSGFTKALLYNNPKYDAFDWKELLQKTAMQMGVKRAVTEEGMPFPQIATTICEEYSKNANCSYKDAERKLKYTISSLVNVFPTDKMINKYEKHFKTLAPNWIVTTNYDSIIEQILKDKAFPINPNNSFYKARNFVPVYHIHGSKNNPDTIVITNEDYTHTLRLSDYRHARLPFLMKESTVLMMGYSLNDLNVLSAVDYCKNVYSNFETENENQIVQLLYERHPKEPYYDKNGIIIYEMSDISEFLTELSEYNVKYRGVIGKKAKEIKGYIEQFINADSEYVKAFAANKEERLAIIKYIQSVDLEFRYVYPSYIAFLSNVLGYLWDKASEKNNFHYYNTILVILIDLIKNIDYSKIPNEYLDFLVDEFNDLAPFVGNSMGESWEALSTWDTEKNELPKDFIDEIRKRTNENSFFDTWRLIKDL